MGNVGCDFVAGSPFSPGVYCEPQNATWPIREISPPGRDEWGVKWEIKQSLSWEFIGPAFSCHLEWNNIPTAYCCSLGLMVLIYPLLCSRISFISPSRCTYYHKLQINQFYHSPLRNIKIYIPLLINQILIEGTDYTRDYYICMSRRHKLLVPASRSLHIVRTKMHHLALATRKCS